ncbi:MAG: hypothetical protein KME23_08030 [Goleter apudmare HA4340-LM2]|jgi:hypothetical protein|nr:hypothetical protein [Goleter apudmare HA4340-LM2]
MHHASRQSDRPVFYRRSLFLMIKSRRQRVTPKRLTRSTTPAISDRPLLNAWAIAFLLQIDQLMRPEHFSQ